MDDIVKEFESPRDVKTGRTEFSFRAGCTLLDHMIGAGVSEGSPSGRIIHFIGESSAGKSFFACEHIAAAYRQYKDKFHWVYDDAERGYSFKGNSMKLWGIDIVPQDDSKAVRSKTVEELFYNVRKFLRGLKSDEFGIYVVDSLDGLSNEEYQEIAEERMRAGDRGEAYDKGNYGMKSQKFLSQEFFRTLAGELEEKNSLLIFLSQLRDNVNAGLYGPKRRVSGGSALKFFCDTEIELKLKEKFMKNDLHYGSCIEASLVKSKTDRPNRKCYVNLLFDYGIDDISTNIDYVFDLKSGDTGKLRANTACNIGDTSDPRYGMYEFSMDGLRNLLQDEKLTDEMTAYSKANGGKKNKDTVVEFLKTNHPDLFKAYYGEPVEREALIMRAEEDKSLRRVLRQRALDKWEALERMVASNRRKYSDDEEY